MTENNAVTNFEQNNIGQLISYASLEQAIKKATETRNDLKEHLLNEMQEMGIKSFENDFVKITLVDPSELKTVDLKAFQKNEPADYSDLISDYPKITKRKASIRITVKDHD
ncbi:hypothetical protein EFN43_09295 [Pediococcus pentosaceus]|uniref:hypothetical protein n=1 Tax=Pediococcus pentosaceus TaxID=1255 RepID=UPI001330791D|nr:hypothetical protein [Pediococcus pentosaceus]KAF0422136.1 hypothetical protein GBO84_02050 [Pediococcus pentosaceus]MCT3021252.1 hypothetical protein [Pediococcus pentosaceus]